MARILNSKSIFCPHCSQPSPFTPTALDVPFSGVVAHVPLECRDEKGQIRWWIGGCNLCTEYVLIDQDGTAQLLPMPITDRIPRNVRKDLTLARICLTAGDVSSAGILLHQAMRSSFALKKIDTTGDTLALQDLLAQFPCSIELSNRVSIRLVPILTREILTDQDSELLQEAIRTAELFLERILGA